LWNRLPYHKKSPCEDWKPICGRLRAGIVPSERNGPPLAAAGRRPCIFGAFPVKYLLNEMQIWQWRAGRRSQNCAAWGCKAMKKSTGGIISINAPVILELTFVAFAILLIDSTMGGAARGILASRFTSWLDPLMYVRLFTRILVHADFEHFFGNFMLILVVGPMMEEKYGSRNLLWMLFMTAFVTGTISLIFFRNVILIGASGLAFMLILLASFANFNSGGLPMTVLLVGALYIGNEVLNGLLIVDSVSQSSHIIGGLCGAVFGFTHRNRTAR
jgi:membrane associated rhomboid family serine protease